MWRNFISRLCCIAHTEGRTMAPFGSFWRGTINKFLCLYWFSHLLRIAVINWSRLGSLKQGKSIHKWDSRTNLGIYIGRSIHHARNISMILNLDTGLVSPQFHVKHDPSFGTVQQPWHFKSQWQRKADIHLQRALNTKEKGQPNAEHKHNAKILQKGKIDWRKSATSYGRTNPLHRNNDNRRPAKRARIELLWKTHTNPSASEGADTTPTSTLRRSWRVTHSIYCLTYMSALGHDYDNEDSITEP